MLSLKAFAPLAACLLGWRMCCSTGCSRCHGWLLRHHECSRWPGREALVACHVARCRRGRQVQGLRVQEFELYIATCVAAGDSACEEVMCCRVCDFDLDLDLNLDLDLDQSVCSTIWVDVSCMLICWWGLQYIVQQSTCSWHRAAGSAQLQSTCMHREQSTGPQQLCWPGFLGWLFY